MNPKSFFFKVFQSLLTSNYLLPLLSIISSAFAMDHAFAVVTVFNGSGSESNRTVKNYLVFKKVSIFKSIIFFPHVLSFNTLLR